MDTIRGISYAAVKIGVRSAVMQMIDLKLNNVLAGRKNETVILFKILMFRYFCNRLLRSLIVMPLVVELQGIE